jgi:hypothetical protein
MISFSTFKESVVANGIRILKVMQFGLKTAGECMPFGDDGNPLAGMSAVYAKTSNIAEPVIIGYINKQRLAGPGEKRLYSLQADGTLSTYAWLHSDGTMELAGNGNNLVRYQALHDGLNTQDDKINAELAKIEAAIATLGGTYVPATISTDITNSKINEIKCI